VGSNTTNQLHFMLVNNAQALLTNLKIDKRLKQFLLPRLDLRSFESENSALTTLFSSQSTTWIDHFLLDVNICLKLSLSL
jgi:hypothetical protein